MHKTHVLTQISKGPLLWCDVWFQAQTSYGDVVRVLGPPPGGLGVAWNLEANDESLFDFLARLRALLDLLLTLRDRETMERALEIAEIFLFYWPAWVEGFKEKWMQGEIE